MRLAIGVIGGLLIGGGLGAQLSGDLVMLTAPIGAVIGAWLAHRGRASVDRDQELDQGEWHDGAENQGFGGFFGGGGDDDGGDDGGD